MLQSGLGDGRATWNTLWPQLTVRHCVFVLDRPGYGDSPSTSAPRDPCQAARELHAALRDAHVPPPYLLVGHSLGGLYQVVFAWLYPDETAGLLLLDPTHPEHWATLQRETPKTAAIVTGLRSTLFTPTMRAEFDAQAQCLDSSGPEVEAFIAEVEADTNVLPDTMLGRRAYFARWLLAQAPVVGVTPGRDFHYSNAGYVLVAAMVEARTGKAFEAVTCPASWPKWWLIGPAPLPCSA